MPEEKSEAREDDQDCSSVSPKLRVCANQSPQACQIILKHEFPAVQVAPALWVCMTDPALKALFTCYSEVRSSLRAMQKFAPNEICHLAIFKADMEIAQS
jgi:hypothetical protein